MSNTALITGASSGIGREFARYHAQKGGDLIITARREAELEELKRELEAQYKISVTVIPLDLGSQDGVLALVQKVRDLGKPIDILINNAGFGGHGRHVERPLDDEIMMLNLNILALTTLCHEIGGDMAKQGSGKILNLSSVAGFMPGPLQAVYFATKSYVNSFSFAIDQELRSKGVTVSVLAPGYTETEFAKTAKIDGLNMVKGGGASAEDVAKTGYDAMMGGKLLVFHEKLIGFGLTWIVPLLPRRLVLKLVERMQSK